MAISALSNASFLQPTSSSSTIIPLQTQQSLQSPEKSVASTRSSVYSSAQTGTDTYTPSDQNQTSDGIIDIQYHGGYGITTASMVSGISQSTLTAMANSMQNMTTPTEDAWGALNQSMRLGDTSGAQTALNTYTQSLSISNDDMSVLTTPSAQFMSDLTSLGSALSAGNLSAAQTAYKTAEDDRSEGGISDALSAAEFDGGQAVLGMEDNLSTSGAISISGATTNQLSNDLTTLNNVIRESEADMSDYLVSQGFSSSDANAFISAGLNASFRMNSDSDSTASSSNSANVTNQSAGAQTAEWIGDLTNYAQEKAHPISSQNSAPTEQTMFAILNSVLADSTALFTTTH